VSNAAKGEATYTVGVPTAPVTPTKKVAVFIAHGMGQQIPFQTLDQVAEGLLAMDGAKGNKTPPPVSRAVKSNDQWFNRVELQLKTATKGIETHVYEAYWAPLTEGKVTIRDVIRFLAGAGRNGVRNAHRGRFFRWLFDRYEMYPIPVRTHPTTVSKRLALVRAEGKWGAIADSLRLFFATPPADFSKLQPNARDAIQLQLDSLRDELAEAERNPTALRLGKISDRFRLRFGMGPPVSYTLFSGRGATVGVSDSTDQTTRRSVCWLAFAAHDVTSQARLRSLTDVAAALHRLDTRWSNFMNRGYSMLPHELLINGWTDALIKGLSRGNDLEPPRVQFIVAHPSAGTQVVSATLRTLRVLQTHRLWCDAAREPVRTCGVRAPPRGPRRHSPQWLSVVP
jgi:hypothetical protein